MELLQKYARKFFPATKYLDYAVRVEAYTLGKAANLVMNVDGCIGALFLDLLNSSSQFTQAWGPSPPPPVASELPSRIRSLKLTSIWGSFSSATWNVASTQCHWEHLQCGVSAQTCNSGLSLEARSIAVVTFQALGLPGEDKGAVVSAAG